MKNQIPVYKKRGASVKFWMHCDRPKLSAFLYPFYKPEHGKFA